MKWRPAVVAFVLPLFFGFASASGAPRPDPVRRAALDRLRAAAGERLEVRWDEGGTRVRTLAGPLAPPRSGAAEEVARTFLQETRDIFGFEEGLGDLRLRGVRQSPGGAHVGFDQEHQGLPVFDGGLEVHLDRSGAVFLVQSAYAGPLEVETTPRLSAAAAKAAALRRFAAMAPAATDKRGRTLPASMGARASGGIGHAGGAQVVDAIRLGILDRQGSPVLVYRVLLYAPAPVALVESFVDARDGSLVLSRNLVQTATTGQGKVFDPNPVVTLGDTTLRDHDDAADPSLDAASFNRPLPGITRLFGDVLGPYILSGPYVRVADLKEAPTNPVVSSPNGHFLFTRDQQGFEAAMVYFHIDRSQRYIQSLGFLDVNNRALAADPHGLRGADNSHYVPLPFGAGWVAFGEGGVDDAEDADVILHEYGHAIQDNQNPARFLPFGETGAMGEGFGDYWAFSNSPQDQGDPACIAEWDFEGTCLRRVDGTRHYPEDLAGEVHADGEIWSALLHDVFGALGKEKADRTVLESHFLVPKAPDFCDGAHALREAASSLYGDSERTAVGVAAAARGIAGDLAFSPVAFDGRPPLTFAITNSGPCAVGPARHAIVQVTETGETLVGYVDTPDLAPGEIANLEFDPPGAFPGEIFRVLADADGVEAETDEANNVLQFDPILSPFFGRPPRFASAEAAQLPGEAVCDYTAQLQGLLCDSGLTTDLFAAPFPTETITARYTEARVRAGVTDPDSTASQNDILVVTASILVPGPGGTQEISFVLLDDGGASGFTFRQDGTRAEQCDIDPALQICSCTPATYRVSSGDATAADTVYTRVLPLVKIGPEVAGANAGALLTNCIARANGLAPIRVEDTFDPVLEFKLEAVDRAGNLSAWPTLLPVTPAASGVTCSGDACGCCLLLSTDPSADPSAGGCAGLPGLNGVPGSGFENGLCHLFSTLVLPAL